MHVPLNVIISNNNVSIYNGSRFIIAMLNHTNVNRQLLYIFYEVGNLCELVGINTRPKMIASINELNQSNVTMM